MAKTDVKSGPTLFAIAGDALAIEKLIFEEGGELSPTLEAWLAEVDTALSTKADSYEYAMKHFEATENMLKARAKAIIATAKALENARERMKARIKDVMRMTNQPEIKGSHVVFKLVTGQRIRRVDEKLLHDMYKKERQVTEKYIDETLLQEHIDLAMANKMDLPPGVSFERVYSLRTAVAK